MCLLEETLKNRAHGASARTCRCPTAGSIFRAAQRRPGGRTAVHAGCCSPPSRRFSPRCRARNAGSCSQTSACRFRAEGPSRRGGRRARLGAAAAGRRRAVRSAAHLRLAGRDGGGLAAGRPGPGSRQARGRALRPYRGGRPASCRYRPRRCVRSGSGERRRWDLR